MDTSSSKKGLYIVIVRRIWSLNNPPGSLFGMRSSFTNILLRFLVPL
jgi:hypothetical protein